MIPENNRLSLNASKPLPPVNNAPLEEPRKVWAKRWFAHLADFFITVILSFIVYLAIGMPIAESTPGYQDMVTSYNELTDQKFDFLICQHILLASSKDEEKYLPDEQTLTKFVRFYLEPQTDDYDFIKKYYLTNNLQPYNQTTAGENYRPEYQPDTEPKTLSEDEYNELLKSTFNDKAHEVFTEKMTIVETTKKLLSDYLSGDTYDTNTNFWRYMLSRFNTLRLQATKEALSSLEEMPREIALVETYALINYTRVEVLLISWAVAYLLAFGLPLFFFKNGRTIGKRVLGFYVVSKNDTKASIFQQIGRLLLIFPQTFFGLLFPMFLIFQSNLFNIPVFGSMTILIPATISFVLLLCSDALSFIARKEMSNLQDWCTYTKVIYLKDGHGLDEVIKERKPAAPKTTVEDIADNIWGKQNE